MGIQELLWRSKNTPDFVWPFGFPWVACSLYVVIAGMSAWPNELVAPLGFLPLVAILAGVHGIVVGWCIALGHSWARWPMVLQMVWIFPLQYWQGGGVPFGSLGVELAGFSLHTLYSAFALFALPSSREWFKHRAEGRVPSLSDNAL